MAAQQDGAGEGGQCEAGPQDERLLGRDRPGEEDTAHGEGEQQARGHYVEPVGVVGGAALPSFSHRRTPG